MAFVLADRAVRPLTADEVLRMVELGILSEDEPIELLHGALTKKVTKSREHGAIIARLTRWLVASDPEQRLEILTESPLRVPDRTSLPEPDLLVIPSHDQDLHGHPTTASLVIEVASSSLRIDIGIKPPLYAEGGSPEYWVVDVAAKQVEVFTQPHGDRYAHRATHAPPAMLQPGSVPVPALALEALFAGL